MVEGPQGPSEKVVRAREAGLAAADAARNGAGGMKGVHMTEKHVAEVEAVRHPGFEDFVATIEALRAPDGCPWDREQTHLSIAQNMIEEAYEAVDAIESDDVAHLREELGDVLLQVVLQSQIASDAGEFDIDDVCRDINEKMIRRHPHVFGSVSAENANEVLGLWEQVKLAEKAAADEGAESRDVAPAGLLEGVPVSFPALMQAQKISRKAAAVGFEWSDVNAVWEKVDEEIAELKEAYASALKSADGRVLKDADAAGDADAAALAEAVELEFGDVLFSLVNVARRMGVDSERALRGACAKFRRRWAFMEGAAWSAGERIEDASADRLEELWQAAKAQEVSRG